MIELGTPMNHAVLQRRLEMKVLNFGPFTGADDVMLAVVEKGRWKTLERGLRQ